MLETDVDNFLDAEGMEPMRVPSARPRADKQPAARHDPVLAPPASPVLDQSGFVTPRTPRSSVRFAPCERLPNRYYAHFKRVTDIVWAALGIICLSPVILACAIAVKATSPGPVLFRRKRWGRSQSQFDCWKFRTMIVDTPPDIPAGLFAEKALFMTACGDFLRRWSLDELPQLFNILKGDMSLIGPRPVIIPEKDLIDKREPLNANGVRPGLTGWAQVNGRNLISNTEKAWLDGEYVANLSFALDTRIFFRTIAVVFGRRGVDRDVPAGEREVAQDTDRVSSP